MLTDDGLQNRLAERLVLYHGAPCLRHRPVLGECDLQHDRKKRMRCRTYEGNERYAGRENLQGESQKGHE